MSLELAALCGFAFLAGFIDAVAGGGGLIQVPALMVLLPQVPIPVLFGTNKCVSIWGTATATWLYLRHVDLPRHSILPTALAALACGYLGAAAVSALDSRLLRPMVLVALFLVLAYTLWRKDFGRLHAPRLSPSSQVLAGLLVGAAIGFYDGFFGPGTGSFLVLGFVAVFGFSFLHASAAAKIVNVVTNLAAIGYFVPHGQVLWALVVPMAACNLAGGLIGARLAIRRGSGFVRLLFLIVVGALMLKLGSELWIEGNFLR